MAEADDNWSTNSNDAFAVSLITPSQTETKTLATFNPKFTYPIFGEDERIFGYQNLKINLRYHASDMRPNVKISYSKKFKAVGDTEPTDIDGLLNDFLPEVAFAKEIDFTAAIRKVPDDWTPPGKLLASFENKDGPYEIWKASLAEPAVQQMIKRIQILVLFFIEGGSYIGIDEQDPSIDRWTVFFLYQRRPVVGEAGRFSYHFAGYSTVYRFYLFQAPTPPATPPKQKGEAQPPSKDDLNFGDGKFSLSELPCRSRISQFVIIPPFQGKGNGARLYSTIFEEYLAHPQTVEITVEDPNEAFDDLRDLCDLAFLRKIPDFDNLSINREVHIPEDGPAPRNIIDTTASETLRRRVKIAPRQFSRVLEMNLMSKLPDTVRPGISVDRASKTAIPDKHEHEYNLWKLLVKQRLYRHNKDALSQLDPTERIEKLAETLSSVEFEYARLLALHERRNQLPGGRIANGKRKAAEADEPSSSKKPRIEDA